MPNPPRLLARFLPDLDPRGPEAFLLVSAAAMPIALSTWQALLNNYAVERAAFSGAEMGLLQSVREVPGLLALTVVFLLAFVREQTLLLACLLLLGLGTALTGVHPSLAWIYATTVLMSVGFHYQETLQQSLTLQWIGKAHASRAMGWQLAARAVAGIAAFAGIWLMLEGLGLDYAWIYAVGGGLTMVAGVIAWRLFPRFPDVQVQSRKLVLRSRYWLFYALTFMGGARRQILIAFAGFMMVERFGYSASQMTLLFVANQVVSMIFAPRIGALIGRWGERRALTLEYAGLVGVFAGYAFVESAPVAVALYLVDHLLFALAIAIRSYFQKIADPADIASSSGLSFTINHIAAVIVPGAFGLIWLVNPAAVFLAGAGMAAVSLGLARLVPGAPEPGRETVLSRPPPAPAAG